MVFLVSKENSALKEAIFISNSEAERERERESFARALYGRVFTSCARVAFWTQSEVLTKLGNGHIFAAIGRTVVIESGGRNSVQCRHWPDS